MYVDSNLEYRFTTQSTSEKNALTCILKFLLTEYSMQIQEQEPSHKTLQEHFPHIIFGIVATLLVFLIYMIGSSISFSVVGLISGIDDIESLSGEVSSYMQGISQLLWMLLPTIFISAYSPLATNGLLRREKGLLADIKVLDIVALVTGIIGVGLFTQGWGTIQAILLPESIYADLLTMAEDNQSILLSILKNDGSIFSLIRNLIVIALIPAVAEEFLFRGILQRSLEEKMSLYHSVLISSVMFALIHFNLLELVPIAVIGAVLGVSAWSTRSLLLPMVGHFLNNAISVLYVWASGVDVYSTNASESYGQGLQQTSISWIALGLVVAGAMCVTGSIILMIHSRTSSISIKSELTYQ